MSALRGIARLGLIALYLGAAVTPCAPNAAWADAAPRASEATRRTPGHGGHGGPHGSTADRRQGEDRAAAPRATPRDTHHDHHARPKDSVASAPEDHSRHGAQREERDDEAAASEAAGSFEAPSLLPRCNCGCDERDPASRSGGLGPLLLSAAPTEGTATAHPAVADGLVRLPRAWVGERDLVPI